MTQLPFPDGALFPKTDEPLQLCAPLGGYAPDTVRQLIAQARSDALEEAAAVTEKQWEIDGWLSPKEVASYIRALKEKQ